MIVPSLTLIGKSGCHLCDEARAVVTEVVAALSSDGIAVDVSERSILEEPDLDARWHDDIPVVLIGTALHDRWHIDAARLRADLLAASGA